MVHDQADPRIWTMLRGPVQIAYAVEDVVAAAHDWVDRGAGPFFVRQHIAVSDSRMHGAPAPFDHSSAYGQWGEVMVELICEHHDEDQRIGGSTGVHHMAFFVDDFEATQAALQNRGWDEVLFARAGTTPFAMHDARAELGHLVEIYHDSAGLTGFYDMVRHASLDWDGTDPVRLL